VSLILWYIQYKRYLHVVVIALVKLYVALSHTRKNTIKIV